MPARAMPDTDDFVPQYTSTLDAVGVSAHRPVRVGSWIAGEGPFRSLLPGHPDYPGAHYGNPVYVPELQDRRPHTHAHFEISIIRAGRARHRTVFGTEELLPGTVIVLAPGMTHAIFGLEGLHQTNLYYLTEWLADDLMAHWREAGLVPLFLGSGRVLLRALSLSVHSRGVRSVAFNGLLRCGCFAYPIFMDRPAIWATLARSLFCVVGPLLAAFGAFIAALGSWSRSLGFV